MKKLIAVLLALVCVLGSAGCNATPSSVDKLSEAENTIGEANPKIVTADAVTPIALEDNWLMPLDLFIDSGNIENNTGLSVSKKLNKDNGKYVGLYVENKGSGPVVATINFSEMTASLSGKPLVFTPLEYRLLKILTKNPQNVLTRQVLLEKLWDADGNFVDEHALTAAISRVRNKIETEGCQYIKTVYGMGYMWIGGASK